MAVNQFGPLLPIGMVIKAYGMELTIIGYNENETGLYCKDKYPYKCLRKADNYRDVYGFYPEAEIIEGEKVNLSLYHLNDFDKGIVK